MDQTGIANCCLSSQTITLSTMSPDWEAMASLQPRPGLLCSCGLSAAIEAERARITLRTRITMRAWHVFSAASHAKEELRQKKGRMKLVKNKKLEDKSKIHKVLLEDECGPILTQVYSFVIPPRRTKLNGDQWVAVD